MFILISFAENNPELFSLKVLDINLTKEKPIIKFLFKIFCFLNLNISTYGKHSKSVLYCFVSQ